MNSVSKRLKELRTKLDLTQKELGEKVGKSWYQIKDIETEKTRLSLTLAELLYHKTGVNLEWLLTGNGEMFLRTGKDVFNQKDRKMVEEAIKLAENILILRDNLSINTDSTSKTYDKKTIPTVREDSEKYHHSQNDVKKLSVNNYPLISDKSNSKHEEIVDFIPLPEKFNINANFVIKMKEQSMIEYGITPGMLVFIKKQDECTAGDIVALQIEKNKDCKIVIKKAKILTSGVMVFQNGGGDIIEKEKNIKIIGTVNFWMKDYR